MKNLKTHDAKHQNPRPNKNMIHMINYEATDL